jgi:hypothetical protein
MLPSIDLRLASMIRAVKDIILPALEGGDGLATEQAGLLLGHLLLLREQVGSADLFQRREAEDLLVLGESLVERAAGGSATLAARDALAAVIRDSPHLEEPQSISGLRAGMSALLEASGIDGTGEFRNMSSVLTIHHARAAARLERSWFAPIGFEAEGAALPSFPDLVAELKAR